MCLKVVLIKIWNFAKILFIEHKSDLSKGQFYKGKIISGEKFQFCEENKIFN